MAKYLSLSFNSRSGLYFNQSIGFIRVFVKWNLFKKKYYFFLNLFLKGLYYSNFLFFFSNFKFIFSSRIFSFLFFFSSFFWGVKNFSFRLFKAHGINMRIVLKRPNTVLMRLGGSHIFKMVLPSLFIFRVFKKRYFLLLSYNNRILDYVGYHFRYFRRFFRYKLIGLKYLRDNFKIKVGKKKAF